MVVLHAEQGRGTRNDTRSPQLPWRLPAADLLLSTGVAPAWPFQKRSSSKASCLRSKSQTDRASRAARLPSTLAGPCFFSCFCFHGRARSLVRRNRQAASAKAQRRWALPIFLPPEPSFLPADSWSQRTSRA